MNRVIGVIFTLLMLALAYFAFDLNQEASNKQVINGEISYRVRMAIPPDSTVNVSLIDTSIADSKAKLISQTSFSPSSQVPIAFQLTYDPKLLEPERSYTIQASIKVKDKYWFITTKNYPFDINNPSKKYQLDLSLVKGEPKLKHKLESNYKQSLQSNASQEIADNPFKRFPMHFINQNKSVQIDLLSNQVFIIASQSKSNNSKEPKIVYQMGRWQFDKNSNQLKLISENSFKPIIFHLVDSETLEVKLANDIITLDEEYKASSSAAAIFPKLTLSGMYQYMADSARFSECVSGIHLPVMFNQDHLALEQAYTAKARQPGEPLFVKIEASIIQQKDIEEHSSRVFVQVDKFLELSESKKCADTDKQASFYNTYWRLKQMAGKAFLVAGKGSRDVFLQFMNTLGKATSFRGATGCNMIAGEYKTQANQLNIALKPIISTMMSCSAAESESQFLSLLPKIYYYQITGHSLNLYDKDKKKLAQFEAIYFN